MSQVIINKKQYWFSKEHLHQILAILTSFYIWDNIYLYLRSLSFGGSHSASIAHSLEGLWCSENIDLGGQRRQKQDAIIVGFATRGRGGSAVCRQSSFLGFILGHGGGGGGVREGKPLLSQFTLSLSLQMNHKDCRVAFFTKGGGGRPHWEGERSNMFLKSGRKDTWKWFSSFSFIQNPIGPLRFDGDMLNIFWLFVKDWIEKRRGW